MSFGDAEQSPAHHVRPANGDATSTAEIIAELTRMKADQERIQRERHALNGVMHEAIGGFSSELRNVADQQRQLFDMLKRVEMVLLGDESMKTDGLVQWRQATDKKLEAVDERLDKHESRFQSFAVGAVVLAGAGALLVWLKEYWFTGSK